MLLPPSEHPLWETESPSDRPRRGQPQRTPSQRARGIDRVGAVAGLFEAGRRRRDLRTDFPKESARNLIPNAPYLSRNYAIPRECLLDLFVQELRRSSVTDLVPICALLTPRLAQKSAAQPLRAVLHSYG